MHFGEALCMSDTGDIGGGDCGESLVGKFCSMLTPIAKLRETKDVMLAILTLYLLFGRTVNTTGAHWVLFILQVFAPVIAASEQLYCPLPLINRLCVQ